MKNRKLLPLSFGISLIYVLLGTMVVLVSFPKFQTFGFSHEHPLWLPLVIFTLPVNILLFGLAMVDLSFSSIFILQIIVFLICWGVIHLMIKTLLSTRKKKKQNLNALYSLLLLKNMKISRKLQIFIRVASW